MKTDISHIKPSYARKGNSKSASVDQRTAELNLIKKAPGLHGLSRFSAGPIRKAS